MQKTRTKDAELTQVYIIMWVMRSQFSPSLGWEEKSTGTLRQKGWKESSRDFTDLIKVKAECLKLFLNSFPIT